MKTTQDIINIWDEKIFSHDDILELTDSIFNHDILFQEAETENTKLYFDNGINYCVYRVTRSPKQYGMTKNRFYLFTIKIDYTLEKLPNNNAELRVSQFFEVLDNLVHSELGVTWDEQVTISNPQAQVLDAQAIQINNLNCIRATTEYRAEYHFVEN